jgi:NodT family efflux transporter outer membrane factor (OMF) lipoprotein
MKHSGLFTLVLLAGCASLPGKTPPPLKPATSLASTQSFSATTGQWPSAGWWQVYGDAQLNALIDEALAAAPSLAAAEARLQRARGFESSARGALMPNVTGNTAVTTEKQSYRHLSPAPMTPQGWHDYGRATLDITWEIDFWGRNRAALAAATSEVVAMAADVDQARLALSSAIAAGYAELAREYAAVDTATAARDLRAKTADLFGKRFEHGLETQGSLRQAESRRAASEAELLALEEQIALQKNRLAALTGAGPDRGLAIVRPSIGFTRAFTLPATLSADLIGRRPDLVAARLRAEAAARRIHVARAAYYPNINLAAFIGVQALGLDMLTKSGADFGGAGPAISLPIFAGRLRGQLHGATAEYAEAVAGYDQALVQALQEVADAAVSQRALQPQLGRVNEAVAAAREAWRVQNDRYQGGLATYLDVLSAEDYLLSTLRTQADLASRSVMNDVALNKALGGGYSVPN